jgi:DNA-binding NarL/FixJ family response regulator
VSRELVRATKKKLRAEQEWEQAIRDAAATGESLRSIAEQAGVSHETVRRITSQRPQ